jgi:hypothetical protein
MVRGLSCMPQPHDALCPGSSAPAPAYQNGTPSKSAADHTVHTNTFFVRRGWEVGAPNGRAPQSCSIHTQQQDRRRLQQRLALCGLAGRLPAALRPDRFAVTKTIWPHSDVFVSRRSPDPAAPCGRRGLRNFRGALHHSLRPGGHTSKGTHSISGGGGVLVLHRAIDVVRCGGAVPRGAA